MPDAMETLRQHMHQEAPDELAGVQRHARVAAGAFDPIILELEAHRLGVGRDQPAIGDRDPVRVTREIAQHLLGSGERLLGVDHPIDLAQRRDERLELGCVDEPGVGAEELQAARVVGLDQARKKQPPEQRRQRQHWQKVVRPARHPLRAISREPATRHHHMHVRMMRQRRAPRVQHRHEADARAQMLGCRRDLQRGLRRRLEQQVVDHRLVRVSDVGDRRGQCVDDVEIRHGKKLGFPLRQPLARSRALALRAVSVAATIIANHGMSARAVLAARNVAAEGRRPATHVRRHHLHLAEAHVTGAGVTPRGTEVAEDIRDLQLWTGHVCQPLGRLALALLLRQLPARSLSASSGLSTEVMCPVATRV